ncbi:MAG: glycoside hydrolase family 127 protein [Ruminococcaceae bacterium]|nr:glycoside hydrolase family 127 protein [Oscillospiraceae bacterium]
MTSKHLSLNNIKIDDPFWNGVCELVRTEVIPYQYEALHDRVEGAEKSYCIENFRKAGAVTAALRRGETVPVYPVDKWQYTDDNCDENAFHGWVFQDSDAYKWLEAVGYSLMNHPDAALERKAKEVVATICAAQLENGYLDTLYIINDRSRIFTNLRDFHELYCFGHLVEGAISFFRATGDRRLLDAACRFADLICETFGEGKKRGYGGHEIAEMALVKLYEETGEKRYLDLAAFFVNERGQRPYYFDAEHGVTSKGEAYHYNQAHRPVRQQNEAVGHAVRGVYLYSGMADVARYTEDNELYQSCQKLWDNIENKKLYITGGIGATVDGEAFSFNYDLPNDLAYSETCASIGLIFFARRMAELNATARFGDVAERALYNTVLSGMGEDGKSFFYVNPLEVNPEASHKDSRKFHIKPVRQKWFACACCPPNLARLISSLGEYAFAENEDTFFIHQYLGARVNTRFGEVRVQSDYIENGTVTVSAENPVNLALRIPSWCSNFTISAPYKVKDGYAYVESVTTVSVQFDCEPKLVRCSNRVRANVGKAAVTMGPLVYCAESVDNGDNLQMLILDRDTEFERDGEYLIVDGWRETPQDSLYFHDTEIQKIPCKIKLHPYYRWGNRGENEMQVYLRVQ